MRRLRPPLRPTAALGLLAAAWALATDDTRAQMATVDRLQQPGWWPRKGSPARSDYVGAKACASCHRFHAAEQQTTAMARTLQRAADSELLRAHDRLTFRHGAYTYEITRREDERLYTASDGERSVSVPLEWVFGLGNIGQTFVFERGGTLYESRVSYFERPRALDFTPGRALQAPRNPERAIGRPIPEDQVRRCFGCHSTAAVTEEVFDASALVPGVTCEACHGPGREHGEHAAQGRLDEAFRSILNPVKLDPAAAVDLCGACHATYWDVRLAAESQVAALRSQPYRLQTSRCWSDDRRITCTACHDPHAPLERNPVSYDRRCLACHAPRGSSTTPEHPVRGCPTGTESCVTCHMPKYPVADMHHEFTDHRIRVVGRASGADVEAGGNRAAWTSRAPPRRLSAGAPPPRAARCLRARSGSSRGAARPRNRLPAPLL